MQSSRQDPLCIPFKGATTSYIRIDIGGGVISTASITNEAVDELKLTKAKPRPP